MKFVEKTKKFEVILYVCCLAIGIWLLIQQKDALNIICWVLGVALIVYGVFVTIGFFTDSSGTNEDQLSNYALAKGVVFSVMGVLVITSFWFVDIFAAIIGILLIINGIISLQKALYLRRTVGDNYDGWKIAVINAVITAAFGIVLIFISTTDIIAIFIGIGLVWYGVSSIVNYAAVQRKINIIVKNRNGSSAKVIDVKDDK